MTIRIGGERLLTARSLVSFPLFDGIPAVSASDSLQPVSDSQDHRLPIFKNG